MTLQITYCIYCQYRHSAKYAQLIPTQIKFTLKQAQCGCSGWGWDHCRKCHLSFIVRSIEYCQRMVSFLKGSNTCHCNFIREGKIVPLSSFHLSAGQKWISLSQDQLWRVLLPFFSRNLLIIGGYQMHYLDRCLAHRFLPTI